MLRALISIFVFAAFLLSTGSVDAADHLMGHRLNVRDYPAHITVIQELGAVHTYPEAFEKNENRHAWGALGGHEGGNVLGDTTTECMADQKCIDISTVNFILSESPCIWPVKPYYAVVGICWNAANRGLFYTQKTVHNVKYYNIVEWWFGTYGLDDGSLCFTNTCRQGRELYGWSKCLSAVNEKSPWQGKPIAPQSGNSRINLYNRYYGPTAGSFKNENTWVRYLQDLVDLQMNEKLPGLSADKRSRIRAIHSSMLQRNNQLVLLANENPDQYRKNLEDALNRALDEVRKVLTDEEYKVFFGAGKSERFALPLEAALR